MAPPLAVFTTALLLAANPPVAGAVRCRPDVLPGFASPAMFYRPKFRYWLPDASVPASSVVQDVRDMHAVGAGGLEFVPYYNYGLSNTNLTDWNLYGFGSAAFKDLFVAALNASADKGMLFDFALGANQGQGVPSVPATEGLQMELVYGIATVGPGEVFDGALPAPIVRFNALTGFMNPDEPWGSNELLAVSAAQVVAANITLAEYFTETVLAPGTLVDLTNQTTMADGRLTWTPPASNATWVVFAFYERYTNERSCVGAPEPSSVLGNGSWMVDHFSAAGAKRTTDFWDANIFNDTTTRALIGKAGEYSWEDSMEMQAALWWTPGFLDRFEQTLGYNLVPYLPTVFHASQQWGGYLPPYNVTWVLDPAYPADGGKYAVDYRTVLNSGYEEYLAHYQQWAEGFGLQHSCQVAYNLNLDMLTDVPVVGAPELESLGFGDDIDLYRQFTGAAHLSGRKIISTEIGAVENGAYTLTVPALANLFRDSFVAGVDKMVIHGYPYSGPYPETTWPGFTTFQYAYTEMWGPRQPAWDFLNDTLMYCARNSLVLQTGTPQTDLAFYLYNDPWRPTDNYFGEELNAAGFNHEYLGPLNLVTPNAVVQDGVLAPSGPAYKALVMYNQTYMTANASSRLLEYAAAGLPIFIVGTVPSTVPGTEGQQEVTANMARLVKAPSVHTVSTANFSASTLTSAGVVPRAAVQAGSSDARNLWSFWTSDGDTGLELVYVFNKGASGTFKMTFESTGTPYFLDAWSGKQSPLLVYNRTAAGITTTLALKNNQTTILAFSPRASGYRNVVAHSDNIAAVRVGLDGTVEALLSDISAAGSVTFSDGSQKAVEAPAGNTTAAPFNTTLDAWNLTVASYVPPPTNSTTMSTIATIDVGRLPSLVPWTDIPALQNVSGIGTYATTFSFPSDPADVSAFVSFGPVLNTIRARVNGRLLPALDIADAVADVTEFVRAGENVLEVEVSSTLFNAVKAHLSRAVNEGSGPTTPSDYTGVDYQESGLVGPVVLSGLVRAQV